MTFEMVVKINDRNKKINPSKNHLGHPGGLFALDSRDENQVALPFRLSALIAESIPIAVFGPSPETVIKVSKSRSSSIEPKS